MSVIYGRRYLQTKNSEDAAQQIHFFNRSLSQITAENFPLGAGKCPEAYYIEDSRNNIYLPNDHVPLAWTQANMGIAIEQMKRTLQISS